jgi:hypothetical protein
MVLYPIYIPMNFGAGGGGPMPLSGVLAYIAIVGGGMYMYYNKKIKPSAELKIKYNKCNKTTQIDVCRKEHNFPKNVSTVSYNTQCLVDKGYIVANPNTKYAKNKRHLHSIRYKDDAPISKEAFLTDCEKCNVKTELEYKYTTIFSNTKRVKNEVVWDQAFKDRHE